MFAVAVLTTGLLVCAVYASPNESRLKHHLLLRSGYDKHSRPVSNSDDALNLTMGLNVKNIVKFDHANEVLHLTAWLNQAWRDSYLKWDPADFGLTLMKVPGQMMWLPDLVPYGAQQKFGTLFPTLVAVRSTGEVLYVPAHVMTFPCQKTDEDGVFECSQKFGSWAYSGQEINLQEEVGGSVDLNNLTPHPHVGIINATSKRNEQIYPCCPETYHSIVVTLRVRIQ